MSLHYLVLFHGWKSWPTTCEKNIFLFSLLDFQLFNFGSMVLLTKQVAYSFVCLNQCAGNWMQELVTVELYMDVWTIWLLLPFFVLIINHNCALRNNRQANKMVKRGKTAEITRRDKENKIFLLSLTCCIQTQKKKTHTHTHTPASPYAPCPSSCLHQQQAQHFKAVFLPAALITKIICLKKHSSFLNIRAQRNDILAFTREINLGTYYLYTTCIDEPARTNTPQKALHLLARQIKSHDDSDYSSHFDLNHSEFRIAESVWKKKSASGKLVIGWKV